MVGVLRLLPLVFRLKKKQTNNRKLNTKHSWTAFEFDVDAVVLTWREHVLECETLDSSIGRIFYYIHRMDKRKGDLQYVF